MAASYTTPKERSLVAKWVRETFDLDIDWQTYEVEEYAESFEVLLLGLEADSIDAASHVVREATEEMRVTDRGPRALS